MCSAVFRTRSQSFSDAQGPQTAPPPRPRRPASHSRRAHARSPLSPPSSPMAELIQSRTTPDLDFANSVSLQVAKWDVSEWNHEVARHRGKRKKYSVDLSSPPARPSSSTSSPVLRERKRSQSDALPSSPTLTRSSSTSLRTSKERTRLPSTSSAFFAAPVSSIAPPAPPPSEDGREEGGFDDSNVNTHKKRSSLSIFSDGAAMEDAFSRLMHGEVAEGSNGPGGVDFVHKVHAWEERSARVSMWSRHDSGGDYDTATEYMIAADKAVEDLSLPSQARRGRTRGCKRRLEHDEDEESEDDEWQVVEPVVRHKESHSLSPTLSSFASTSSFPLSPLPFRGQDPDADIDSPVDIDGDLEMCLTSDTVPVSPGPRPPISISILNHNVKPNLGLLPAVLQSPSSRSSPSPTVSRTPSRSGSGTPPTSLSPSLSAAPASLLYSTYPTPLLHHFPSFATQPPLHSHASSPLRAMSMDTGQDYRYRPYHDPPPGQPL